VYSILYGVLCVVFILDLALAKFKGVLAYWVVADILWRYVGCVVLALGLFGSLLKFCNMDGQMGEGWLARFTGVVDPLVLEREREKSEGKKALS
jgi:hypothetical protein